MPLNFRDHEWVAATATRSFFKEDTLLDWLDLYGESKGFIKDQDNPRYDTRTCMTRFIFAKAIEFEKKVVALLREKCNLVEVSGGTSEERAEETQRLLTEWPEA